MKKNLFLGISLGFLMSSCVTLPHSAHSLGANAIEKPIATKEESIAVLFPVTGGVAYYDVDPFVDFDEELYNSISMRSYFGEAAISFSRPFVPGSLAALSGGISGFGYSGRAVGPVEALNYGWDPSQSFSGFGGRLNLGIDLNWEIPEGMIAWRVLNIQHTYAVESGSYAQYRDFVLDSAGSHYVIANDEFVVPGNTDFRSTQTYTELSVEQGDLGYSFGLGLIYYMYLDESRFWEGYQINGTMHFGIHYREFFGRVNLGSIVPSAGTLPGPLSANLMAGYRYRF